MKPEQKAPSLLTLLLLVPFASISAVFFTPALPEISQNLGLSDSEAQLTITLFLVGYALGVLAYGPIANRYGRKPAIYLGVSLAIVGSLLQILAGTQQLFWLLLIGRVVLALGSCVGLQTAFAIVGDCYQHEKATKITSYLGMALSVGIGVSIAIGGFLTQHFGWPSCFYFLMAYSILLFLLVLRMPETCLKRDSHALRLVRIKEGYFQKLKNKKLLLCSLILGCGTSCNYLFAAEAPFIGIQQIGLNPENYGLFNFIPPIGLIAGSLTARRLVGKKSPLQVTNLGVILALGASGIMLVLFCKGIITVWSLFFPVMFLYTGLAMCFANLTSLAMTHAQNKSNGSAILNFINLGTSSIALFSFQYLPFHPLFLLPLAFTCLVGVMFVFKALLKAELNS